MSERDKEDLWETMHSDGWRVFRRLVKDEIHRREHDIGVRRYSRLEELFRDQGYLAALTEIAEGAERILDPPVP